MSTAKKLEEIDISSYETDPALEDVLKPVVALVTPERITREAIQAIATSDQFNVKRFDYSEIENLAADADVEVVVFEIRIAETYSDIGLIKTLRSMRPLVPIIALNLNDNYELKIMTYQEGATDTIVQDIHWDEMQEKIQAFANLGRASKVVELQNKALTRNYDELLNAEQDRDKSKQMLVQSAKMAALGEIAGNIAHEIKNPLAVIEGRIFAFRKLIKQDHFNKEEATRILDKMSHVTERIATITRGLKSFARHGENDPFEVVSLRTIITDTVAFCIEPFKQAGITLNTSEIDADWMLECRQTQISQILVNLLTNAKDAVEKLDEAWVNLTVKDDGDSYIILIQDNGPGVPYELEQKIFQPFFTTKPVNKGTGLGLSISKTIIQEHHGSFTLDTSISRSCFKIKLPKSQPKT